MKPRVRMLALVFCLPTLAASLPAQENGKPLPFRTAIELALKNSATSGVNRADMERARATVTETRDPFIPSMTIGSTLGYSNGFPLSLENSAPSLFNVNIQGMLLNFAQREYIKAAKSDADTTAAQSADRRNDVIMEAALDYMQLDLLVSSLAGQKEQQAAAAKFQDITSQRIQAGLDSPVELTRAKLIVARALYDISRTEGAADQLRLRLSQLTGLPAATIQTATETIPPLPAVSQNDDLAGEAAAKNPAVKFAEGAALAKEFRAVAEHRQLYPTVDLAGQYAVLARYNNYDVFFKTFERNNLSIGVVIRLPLFNKTLRTAAEVARFDALKARQDARTVKEQVSADTLKLQRSVQQLTAARDVAQLEHELAESDIETTQARIESGNATLKDEQNARVAEHEHYTAYLTSNFDLDKAQVQLLRQTGALENWALGPH